MAVNSDPQSAKETWRKELRPLRTKIDASTEMTVVAHLATFLDHIGGLFLFYRAMSTELQLDSLADQLGWERFVTTRTPETGTLTVHPTTGPMELHRFGYMQPIETAETVPLNSVSVALVPVLAVDTHGNRLGHGAGYYDELLSRLPSGCLRIGVSTERFIFDELPSEPHDVLMTHLASEAGVRAVAGPAS
ncbi:MAG: 5-formyltetrahydrofolate cyclo-ligase [Acidimicrobiales bacterium]|nr:5-formyltetrahydrofolate cyclo-ligase [Acidimicrobiales bacterium]HJL98053.1 5-formyltetrahydrofolate cyclo-ligase [Acidimicrobiales bacterium]